MSQRPRRAIRSRPGLRRLEPRLLLSATWDLLLIDSHLPEAQSLAAVDGGRAVLFDTDTESAGDVLARVRALAIHDGRRIDSLSILSHGRPGAFMLGSQWVTHERLSEQAAAWQGLGDALADHASIRLYGCSVADPAGDGWRLVSQLARLTGALVLASDDLSGAGGDWDLEIGSTPRGLALSAADLPDFEAAFLAGFTGTLGLIGGPETPVNTTTAGAQYLHFRATRPLAMDPEGNFLVAWSSAGQDGDGAGVYYRWFNADGTARSGEVPVNQTTAGDQRYPAVAVGADGAFTIAWSMLDGIGQGVYARMYDAAGTALTDEFRVNDGTEDNQWMPAMAYNAEGVLTVVFSGKQVDAFSASYGVGFKRYDAAGALVTAKTVVNTTITGTQWLPDLAMHADGSFVVVWASAGQDGDGYGVYARRYFADATPHGAEFRVNTTTAGDQHCPSVALDGDGGFVVTWTSNGQDGSGDGIYAQRFDSAGLAVGQEFQVHQVADHEQRYSRVAGAADGSFVITWAHQAADLTWDIHARAYDADGAAASDVYQVNPTGEASQENPALALRPDGALLVHLWAGKGPGDADGIFFRRYAPNSAVDDMAPPPMPPPELPPITLPAPATVGPGPPVVPVPPSLPVAVKVTGIQGGGWTAGAGEAGISTGSSSTPATPAADPGDGSVAASPTADAGDPAGANSAGQPTGGGSAGTSSAAAGNRTDAGRSGVPTAGLVPNATDPHATEGPPAAAVAAGRSAVDAAGPAAVAGAAPAPGSPGERPATPTAGLATSLAAAVRSAGQARPQLVGQGGVTEDTLIIQPEALAALLDTMGLSDPLQQMQEQVSQAAHRERIIAAVTAGSAAGVGATATTGYLLWVLRGGTLLASALTSLPIWRWVDPLPVLDSWEHQKRRRRRRRQAGTQDPAPGDRSEDRVDRLLT